MAKENPTDSNVWTVLEHEQGGLEVWDCDAFGPWHRVDGPFTTYAEAWAAYANRTGEVPVPLTLLLPDRPQPKRYTFNLESGTLTESEIPSEAELAERRNFDRSLEQAGVGAAHDCFENAVPYVSEGALGHGWECGVCGKFLQAG